MDGLSVRHARRLALARAGLLRPERTGLPGRAAGRGRRARAAAIAVIGRFGYLQLDTVSIAGARSHAIVPMSRLEGFDPTVGEELLRPGSPLFEYWGHEACWIPLELYPAFEFRRREFHAHPWWGDVVAQHPDVARNLLQRIRSDGPLRSAELEQESGPRRRGGWWDLKAAKRVASALWSRGTLAIRERLNFQCTYDLAERVIPADLRQHPLPMRHALETLVLKSLDGHGWATTGTIAATWRLVNRRDELDATLQRLVDKALVHPCALDTPDGRKAGWIRPGDLALADRLESARPRSDRGVLLSPFDPVLWDRVRVRQLFGFDQLLEIFKPAAKRRFGYYCLPVLAGEWLVARVDLKADRRTGSLHVLSCHIEDGNRSRQRVARQAARCAIERHAAALRLRPTGRMPG